MKNTKVILFASLFVVMILTFTGTITVDAAQHENSYPNEDSKPSWIINMENRNNDPTLKIGYDCSHGHMSFSCD